MIPPEAPSAGDDDATRGHDGHSVAMRLHDEVVQAMSAALMALGLARMDHPDDVLLRDAEASLDRSATALRNIIRQLEADT